MHVFLIAAQTIDGYIASQEDQVSTSWTSKEDKKWFNSRTKEAGVVVMGRPTYDTIGRPLPGRLNIVYTRHLPEQAEVENGVAFVSPNLAYTSLPPAELLQALEKRGYAEVAICGGASVYSLFLRAGLIDTLYLTIEPIVFGRGVKLFTDITQVNLQLKNTTPLSSQTLLLEYAAIK